MQSGAGLLQGGAHAVVVTQLIVDTQPLQLRHQRAALMLHLTLDTAAALCGTTEARRSHGGVTQESYMSYG